MALRSSGCLTEARRPRGAARVLEACLVLRCARGSLDRCGLFLSCSGLEAAGGTGRSEPRAESRQLAARGRHLHSTAPPLRARPAPPPGRDPPSRRPAPRSTCPRAGLRVPRRWATRARGGCSAPCTPRPGITGGAPAPPWLCLSVDTPRTSRLVFTRALNSPVRRAGAQENNQPAVTCAPPSASLLPTCSERRPSCEGPGTAQASQQVAVQPLGRLAFLDLPTDDCLQSRSRRCSPATSSVQLPKSSSPQPLVSPISSQRLPHFPFTVP